MSESHWLIERLAAGELPPRKAAELQGRTEVKEQLAQIARSNTELLAHHPPERVAREIERRHVRARPARPRLWLTVAAAVGCAVLLWLARDFTYIRDSADVTQRGQQPHLVIFRKTPTGVERLTTQARVRAGDMLQLAYVAAGRKYGVIASSDGRATVAFHLPEHEEVAVRLSDQGQSALPHAFELDDTPGSERFVFISADEPFSTDVVADALQSGFPLGKRYTLHEITLEKLP